MLHVAPAPTHEQKQQVFYSFRLSRAFCNASIPESLVMSAPFPVSVRAVPSWRTVAHKSVRLQLQNLFTTSNALGDAFKITGAGPIC